MIPDFLRGARDEELLADSPGDTEVSNDVPCIVDSIFADAVKASTANLGRSAGQHLANFRAESAPRDAAFAGHYRKIAADAEKSNPPAAAGTPHKLEKRFSSPDSKAPYREFFKTGIEAGKTAVQVLDGWLREFPHHNPDVEKLLREVAAEFV